MLLSILMPCLEHRAWEAMLDALMSQVHPHRDDVEVLFLPDNGIEPSGSKRNRLTARARGEYICFVDDDDRLSPEYVARLVDGCKRGVDTVTFDLTHHRKEPCRTVREEWRFGLWPNNTRTGQRSFNMTVNHLCPVRRDLARRISWCPLVGYADDQMWFKPLLASGLLATRHHVYETLYHYEYSAVGTANQTSERKRFAHRHVGKGLGCYWRLRDGEIVIQDSATENTNVVKVRDRHCVVSEERLTDLDHFHTIHIR